MSAVFVQEQDSVEQEHVLGRAEMAFLE